MNIIFTICSNNYLAQAKVLLDSVLKYEPKSKFIIGLVDKKHDDVDYSFFKGADIIECDKIGIPDFDTLWKKFNIIELNTAVKPFYIEYFFKNYKNTDSVIYLDPDIEIFSNLSHLYKNLESNDILLTPHILTPIPLDNKTPQENLFLNYGIYNLGFIALKCSENVHNFMKWWQERTYHKGFIREKEGLFVDQLWINFVPLFFQNVMILNHLGCNIAPWNLHERLISENGEKYMVNDKDTLIFYHFSGYKPKQPDAAFSFYTRVNFNNRPDLVKIYQTYHQRIIDSKYDISCNIKCFWINKREEYLTQLKAKELQQQHIIMRAVKKVYRKLNAAWKTP